MKSNSANWILAKIAYQINPDRIKFPVYNFEGWSNPHLCHFQVAQFLSEGNPKPDDEIVLFGTDIDPDSADSNYVSHSIVVDKDGNFIVDTLSLNEDDICTYVKDVGYFIGSHKIGSELFRLNAEEFFNTFMSEVVTFPAQSETALTQTEDLAQKFIVSCYIVFRYMLGGPESISTDAKNKLKAIQEDMQKFLTKYKVGYRTYNKIVNAITTGRKLDDSVKEIIKKYGKELKAPVKSWTSNRFITSEQLNLMKAFGTYIRREGDAAKNHLLKNVNKARSRSVVTLFADKSLTGGKESVDLSNHKTVIDKIKALTKKMVGNPVEKMSLEETKEARNKYPEMYKQYNELRRTLVNSVKDYIRLKVRQSKNELYPYKKLVDELNKEKIKHTLPEGFEGYIDEDGNLYTTKKKLIDGRPATNVTMNKEYNPNTDNTNVFVSPSPSGDGVMYFYTVDYKKKAANEKFNKVADLGKKLPAIRRKWINKISAKKRENVIAAILELIYTFAARIGDKNNKANGETTFGMSTIQVKHIKKSGSTYKIAYPGKKGTIQTYELKTSHDKYKQLSDVIDKMVEGKKPTDYVWTWDGELIPVTAIRRYWRSLDAITKEVGVHKIRNAEATRMAKELLSNHPFSKKKGGISQSEVEKWYKEEMKKIGSKLQHQTGEKETGMTAIQSYIDVELQKQFFHDLGLRTPSFLKKFR